MRVKTSITLPAEVLSQIDKLTTRRGNRSRLIEEALRDYLGRRGRDERDRRDRAIIDSNAEALNEEAEDVLSYQVEL